MIPKEFITALGKVLVEELEPLQKSIEKLEQRVADIEKRGVEYVGVFQRAQAYRRGSIVTFENNMHVAICDTQPGEQPMQSPNWQLCLKGTKDRRASTAPRTNGFHPVEHR